MEGTACQELLVSDSNECGSGDTVGRKLGYGKGLREGWDSNELWKSVWWAAEDDQRKVIGPTFRAAGKMSPHGRPLLILGTRYLLS
jgi:hypothetical protein